MSLSVSCYSLSPRSLLLGDGDASRPPVGPLRQLHGGAGSEKAGAEKGATWTRPVPASAPAKAPPSAAAAREVPQAPEFFPRGKARRTRAAPRQASMN